ncbi:MAG: helix-turn-helix domain-containing protein [Alphaproteobacteria bacterium]
MTSVADTIARAAIADMSRFLSRERGPGAAVAESVLRIRAFVARPGWSKSGLARAAGLSVNALREADKDGWNPTADTLRAIERVMDEVDREPDRASAQSTSAQETAAA